MKKAALVLIFLFVFNQSYGWWGDNDNVEKEDTQRESPKTPFDPPYIEPFIENSSLEETESEVKRVSYWMEMRSASGPWGKSLRCKDTHLNLKIKMCFLGDTLQHPVECSVTTMENESYLSRDIWVCELSDIKCIYVVNFLNCDTRLIIYTPRKARPRAQWIVLN